MSDTTPSPSGIHHVTAIAGDPQANVDFYLEVLGLRLVKQTVNQDAPGTYHLYYGDGLGQPGTLMTFFPWPGSPPGRRGTGQATSVGLSVPEDSLGWWAERLTAAGVEASRPAATPDGESLVLEDPDGLRLELVAHVGPDPRSPWEAGPVPAERAVTGIHGVTLTEADGEGTARLLGEGLGADLVADGGGRMRFAMGDGGPGAIVDVVADPTGGRGLQSVGSVHHVAYRAPDDAAEVSWRESLVDRGLDVTPVIDRFYFRSIYFREPGGVLFEIATDPPGFGIDEATATLGEHLVLPPWLEPRRSEIERALPELEVPTGNRGRS